MSELVKVRIKGLVTSSIYGSLSDGDEVNCSAEYAKHLVDDCNAAEYVKPAVAKKINETKTQSASNTKPKPVQKPKKAAN